MTPSELVAIGRALEKLKRPEAKKRQGTRTDLGRGLPLPEKTKSVSPDLADEIESGKTDTLVGKALGIGSTNSPPKPSFA